MNALRPDWSRRLPRPLKISSVMTLRTLAAVHALAEAKSFDAVKAVRDEMEHVKLYGKQVRDRRLIAIATEMQTRAERRLGELIGDAKKAGWISRGNRAQANVPTPEHFTLEEAHSRIVTDPGAGVKP